MRTNTAFDGSILSLMDVVVWQARKWEILKQKKCIAVKTGEYVGDRGGIMAVMIEGRKIEGRMARARCYTHTRS